MRVVGVLVAVAVGVMLLAVELVVMLIRGGTCGSEGGGSCSVGVVDYVLLTLCGVMFAAALLLIVLGIRKRQPFATDGASLSAQADDNE